MALVHASNKTFLKSLWIDAVCHDSASLTQNPHIVAASRFSSHPSAPVMTLHKRKVAKYR
nr:hypothetical protein [Xenorhabdus bovienii]